MLLEQLAKEINELQLKRQGKGEAGIRVFEHDVSNQDSFQMQAMVGTSMCRANRGKLQDVLFH